MTQNNYEDDPFGAPAAPVRPAATTPQAASEVPAAPEIPVEEAFAPAGETATGEEELAPRGGPVANGRRVTIPGPKPLPAWGDASSQDAGDGAEGDVDYSDLEALNRDLQRQRIRMNRIRRQMRVAGREALEAKLTYQRQLRRALVQQTGGSAESRKASAELQCEELEADMAMKAQVADEYSTLFRSIRDDIENAKVVSYNLRAIASI
jgi:hypothetical protein